MNMSRRRKCRCSKSNDKSDSRFHSGEFGMGNLKARQEETGEHRRHGPKMLSEREAFKMKGPEVMDKKCRSLLYESTTSSDGSQSLHKLFSVPTTREIPRECWLLTNGTFSSL
jgi:hypothetical protein